MTTDIDQRMDRAVGRTAQDYRLGPKIDQEVVAGVRQAADMAGADPVAQQHALQIPLEDRRIRVVGARQRMTGLWDLCVACRHRHAIL
jgi:cell division FtsZ-interacting protein ZapD